MNASTDHTATAMVLPELVEMCHPITLLCYPTAVHHTSSTFTLLTQTKEWQTLPIH